MNDPTRTNPAVEARPAPPAPPAGEHPLSYNQQGLWYIHQLDPETAAYNVVFSARVPAAVDVPALRRAFQRLVDRHAALRTTFPTRDGAPVQRIHAHQRVDFAQVDAAGWDEAAVPARLLDETRRPFDLAEGPLMRVRLYTRGAQDHYLVLTVHHIALDFWSLGIVLDELRALYTAELNGHPAHLPVPERQYPDFTHEQAALLSGPKGARQAAYWQEQLAGELPALNLPADRPRPPVQTHRGASHPFRLSPSLTERVKTLARREDATPFVTLLGAFQALLHRYTGQDDILVGSPFFGRQRADLRVVGNFVNTVVLRADFSGDPSFRALLEQARRTVQDALRHQHYPFSLLVERLQPVRDPSRPPLYQAAFSWEALPQLKEMAALFAPGAAGDPVAFGDLALAPCALTQQEGQVDLTLEMGGELDGAFFGVFKYNTDLFDAATIARMAGHLETLLEAVVEDPERPVSALDLLTEAERHQLLVAWNDTAADYPRDRCLHEGFEARAARTPEAVAVMFEDQALSYRALNERANQVAHYLRTLGVGPGTLVGLYLERSVEMLVGLLGVLKAGGAYVPLDPAYPQERIAMVLEDAAVPVLLTQQALADALPEGAAQTVRLDADAAAIGRQPTHNPAGGAAAGDPAYVIFTSGSTGRPKGVQIPHRAVVNFLYAMCHRPGLAAQDVLLSVTTLSFDIAVLELFLPLEVGARVVLVSRVVAADAGRLAGQIAASQATAMQATPATWRLLLEAGWQGHAPLKALCGGETMPRDLADRLLERCTSLWNMYGPTETTIWSAVHAVKPGPEDVPIGRPIANTQLYVLDRHRRPVPVGVPGELFIAGDGLADGYLNRPELTRARFVDNPFAARPGARMYRTGDLVRYRPDGTIEFLGRLDHQVKIRGFRIELGEIEAVLGRHPGVEAAVVLAREDAPGDRRLVAYVVPALEDPPPAGELRAFLKQKLPDYMVPAAFVTLPAFPLTPNGKVDRRALPAPEADRPEGHYVPPRDTLELALARIWEEVLGVRPVGVTDNFFDLGGHSLLAVRMVTRIREQLDRDLPVSVLFRAPTIEQLAPLLQEDRDDAAPTALVALQPGGTKRPLFCPHPIGGNVFCYVPMVRHLDPDQPVYGLQAPGLDDEALAFVQVEDMAGHYIEAMRTAQPEGPYHLAGWCFGGMIAFEMAHQLRAQGEEVALLALLDTGLPDPDGEAEPTDDATLLSWFARDMAVPFGKTLTIPPEALRRMAPDVMFSYVLDRAREAEIIPHNAPVEQLQRYFHIYLANGIALQSYRPRPYDGRLVFLKAREETAADPVGAWSRHGRQSLEVYEVPGDHNTMMYEPQVQAVARRLTRCLESAISFQRSAIGFQLKDSLAES